MKIKFLCALCVSVAIISSAQTNRVWNFIGGTNFSGIYVSSGTTAFVVNNSGRNYIFKLADASTNDLIYIYEQKLAVRQAQLDAEAIKLKADSKMEFTSKFLENFPEKAMNQQGWIDGTFEDFSADGLYGDDKDFFLGFWIKDKSDDAFDDVVVFKKNPHDDQPAPELAEVMKLKHGDQVRFFGCPQEKEFGNRNLRFFVSHIEIIQTAADADYLKTLQDSQP